MEEQPKLTDRQQQILIWCRAPSRAPDAPPTRAEIAAELGFRSPNAAEEHLQALARKGVIELVGGTSRGIRLRPEVLKKLNQMRGKQFNLPLPSLAQLTLPLVGRVAAGSPILAQENIERHYQFDAAMFTPRADYLLKVRGMSMKDAGILDGDLLEVHRSAEAKAGQIVVARIGDEVTVKRVKKRGDTVQLLPENPTSNYRGRSHAPGTGHRRHRSRRDP